MSHRVFDEVELVLYEVLLFRSEDFAGGGIENAFISQDSLFQLRMGFSKLCLDCQVVVGKATSKIVPIIPNTKKYKVKKKFDLLSVDTDSYDFFMLETILEAEYSPLVIVVEYNANFEITEARSIVPPDEDGD